jgi:hypothetical protein
MHTLLSVVCAPGGYIRGRFSKIIRLKVVVVVSLTADPPPPRPHDLFVFGRPSVQLVCKLQNTLNIYFKFESVIVAKKRFTKYRQFLEILSCLKLQNFFID